MHWVQGARVVQASCKRGASVVPAREVEHDVRGQDLGQLALEEAEAAARQDGLRGREDVVLVWAELRPHGDEAHA